MADAPMKNRQGYRGYITLRPIGGAMIPAPMQNALLRTYCAQRDLMFKLSVNEYVFDHCFIQLELVLSQLPELEGVVTPSVLLLPPTPAARARVYERLFADGAEMHFVMENLVIAERGDEQEVETLLRLIAVTEQRPPLEDVRDAVVQACAPA